MNLITNKVLMDADSFLYSTAAKAEQENPCEGREGEYVSDWNTVKHMFDEKFILLKNKLKYPDIQMFISGDFNFRYMINPVYKANRQFIRTPLYLNKLKDYIVEKHGGIRSHGGEADDYTVWYANKYPDSIVLAIDKDVKKQVTNKVYDYWKESYQDRYNKEECEYNFYAQILIGDHGDNLKGCPGIGVKKAQEYIQMGMSKKEYWRGIAKAFNSKGIPRTRALLDARCIRMDQVDPESKRIKLWKNG